MPSTPPSVVEPPRPTDPLAGFLSYLVPGLGQMTQGRFGKGLMFLVCLLGMFHLGEAMGNWQNVYLPRVSEEPVHHQEVPLNLVNSIYNRWHYAGQFWVGIAAWPAIWQYMNLPVPAVEQNSFWNRYQKAPIEEELNVFTRKNDKSPDLGWVFTVIAGMLNILVIYDAFAGPAYVLRSSTERKLEESKTSPARQEAALP